MNDQPINMMDVYTEYVKLRQNGWTIEDAVRDLMSMVDKLSKRERSNLNDLVGQWEAREGVKYRTSQKTQAPESKAPPPVKPARSSVIRPIAPPPQAQPSQPAASGAFGDVPPAGKVFCPQCGKPNGAADRYCFSCGHLLQAPKQAPKSGGTKGLFEEPGLDPRTRWGTAYFGQRSRAVLIVRGVPKPIELRAEGETIIGRASPDSPMRPDIDLAQYDAENLGVSRLHASITRDENTIHITDLSSKNFTFINGQRLFPREVRVLRDGDEIRLGRLSLRIVFKHQE
jgi:hypothetical protein